MPPDPACWDWERLRALSFREAQRVLGNRADAEDAAQAAISRAWNARMTCREPSNPAPWVAQIARREALKLALRRHPVELSDEPATPEHGGTHDPVRTLIARDALADL